MAGPGRHMASLCGLIVFSLAYSFVFVRGHLKKSQEILYQNFNFWASLVAQWLRIHLPMQGTRV